MVDPSGRPPVARTASRRWLLPLGLIAAGIAVVFALVQMGVTDRLPRPWHPSVDTLFPAASTCASCHPTQFQAWQASAHARSSRNPLVHASICGRCHAPLGTQLDPVYQLKEYDHTPMPDMPAAAAESVTCIVCHGPTDVPEEQVLTFLPVWPNWRATDLALTTLPFDQALGPYGTGSAADPAPVPNDSHPSLADPRVASAESCRPCHNVLVDKGPLAPHSGLGQPKVRLLTTYDEWAASPYAAAGRTCQSCHMVRDQTGPSAVAPPGTTYDRPLPARALANHALAGVSTEYLTSGPEVDSQEERSAAHVKGAATVELGVPDTLVPGEPLDVVVTLTNIGAGHELPTGFAYWSEAWLEMVVTDPDGRVVFNSGDVDDEGWLRDEFNPRVRAGQLAYDAYLVSLRARLVTVGVNRVRWLQPDGTIEIPADAVPRNLNGTPIIGTADYSVAPIIHQLRPSPLLSTAGEALEEGYVLRYADTILRNGIPAQQTREAHYRATVAAGTTGPLRVSARLLIRSLWPWMLRQQEELPTPRPQLPIYEIATAQQTVTVVEQ